MSRYGSSRYNNNWKPTPAQQKLANAMGIGGNSRHTDSGYSQEDRYRVDHYLKTVGKGNSDSLTDANVDERITDFGNFKQFAVDKGIEFSDGSTGWLTRREDVTKIGKAWAADKNKERKGFTDKHGTMRLDGATLMKQIYDDLGIVKPMSYHSNTWDENVAHNWNSAEPMSNIIRKIKDGTGEWDKSYSERLNSFKDPALKKAFEERANKVFNHYQSNYDKGGADSLWPTSYRSTLPPPPKPGEDPTGKEFGSDYWRLSDQLDAEGKPVMEGAISRNVIQETVGNDLELGPPGEGVTRLSLDDLNSYMAIQYGAPGQEGEFDIGSEDVFKKPEGGWTDYGSALGKERVEELRTKFIDDLYIGDQSDGTFKTETDPETGLPIRPTLNANVNDSWGLDIVRDWTSEQAQAAMKDKWGSDFDYSKITENQTYEWQTRGLVNWEYYKNDAAFQAAFKDQYTDGDGNVTTGLDETAGISSVGEIRQILKEQGVYKEKIAVGQGKDAWRTQWDGKYEPPPLNDKWNPDEKLDLGKWTPKGMEKVKKDEIAAGPTREVMDASTFRRSLKIGKVEVTKPDIGFDSKRKPLHGLKGPIAKTPTLPPTTKPTEVT